MFEKIESKLVATEKRRNYLVSEPNYHTTEFFTEKLLAIDMRKTQIYMNIPAYLGLSVLDLSKTAVFQFWHDCVKPNIVKKENLVIWVQATSLFT